MLIFGYGPRAPKDRGAVAPLQCTNCGNVSWYDLVTQRSWFNLFFIPVVPVRTTDALVCTTCQHAIPLGRPAATAAIDMLRTTERHRTGQLDAAAYGAAVDAFWQRIEGRSGPGRTPDGASWWSSPSPGAGPDAPAPAGGAGGGIATAAVGGGLLSAPIVRPPEPPPAPPDPFAPADRTPPSDLPAPATPMTPATTTDPSPSTDLGPSTAPGPATPVSAAPPPDAAARRPDPPAGWYADPHGDAGERYWDGGRWTNATR